MDAHGLQHRDQKPDKQGVDDGVGKVDATEVAGAVVMGAGPGGSCHNRRTSPGPGWEAWHVSHGRFVTALAPILRSQRHPGCSTHAGLVMTATDILTRVSVSSIPKRRPFNSPSGMVAEMFRVPSPAMGAKRRLRSADGVVFSGITPERGTASSPWKMRCCMWRTKS